METQVDCPNCGATHLTVASGHRNIVCSACKTEFSVLTKNGKVRSVSKVLRTRTNPTNNARRRSKPRSTPSFNLPIRQILIGVIAFAVAIFLYRWLRFGGIIAILLIGAIYYRFFRKQEEPEL